VTNINNPPKLERIGDKTVDEGKNLSFMIKAEDPDKDSVTLTLVGRPDGSSFSLYEDKQGAFSWTPGFDQAGSYRITVIASDNKSEEYENVIISVRQIKRVISGKIRDDMLNPLSKIKVSITKTGDAAREILTDDNGYYITDDLSPGKYTIRPSFSTSPGSPTSVIVHFNPLSRIVEITNNDQPGIDFSALRQE
jgi:hypothetical protein